MHYQPQYSLYQPLPLVQRDARTPPFSRLARIFSNADFSSPLRCSLLTVNIEQCPHYEALSYTWGQEESSASIDIDGHVLPIRPNLDSALRHLRLPNQDRFLWIDAICINQNDVAERARQVQYMRQVYRNAARVVVWLGNKSPGIELAFQLIGKLKSLMSLVQADPSVSGNPSAFNVNIYGELLASAVSDSPQGSMAMLDNLFSRQYFRRVWCIQEVVASSWATARCEELEIPLSDILGVAHVVRGLEGTMFSDRTLDFWNLIYMKSLPQENTIGQGNQQPQEKSLGTLLELLSAARDFQATDPRDRIFALFGISEESLNPVISLTQISTGDGKTPKRAKLIRKVATSVLNIVKEYAPLEDLGRPAALKPDYNKTWTEVYRDFSRYEMRRSPRVLTVLSHVHHNETPGLGVLPSWVPKWFEPKSASPAGIGLYLAGLCNGHFRYFAVIHDNPLSGHSMRPDILSIDGFLVDQVVAVSDVMEFELDTPIPTTQIWQTLFPFPHSSADQQPYRDGESLSLAFCRTLAMGCEGSAAMLVMDPSFEQVILPGHSDKDSKMLVLKATANADAIRFWTETCGGNPASVRSMQHLPHVQGDKNRYETGIRAFAHRRRAFLTQNGTLGLGPKMMQQGDQVCVLYGGRFPFVIRPTADNHHHIFVGVCYLHDDYLMWGKACESVRFKHRDSPFREQTFYIR